MKEAAYIVLGAAFTTAASYSAGRLLLRKLRLEFPRQEEAAFSFLLGSAILSWLVFAMSAAHVVYKGTFLALGLALIALGWRRSTAEPFPALPRKWIWCGAPVFILFSLLYVCHAMAPEMSPDGSAYHLGLVSRYYREHGFPAITTSIYASLSQGVEMLFLFAFAWGKHSSAALTHLVFLFALASLITSYGRRFGFPLASYAAAALVFLSPVAGLDAASAYNDIALAAVVFAVYYLLEIWEREQNDALLAAVGVLCGFAFAIKYTAFLALPYALCILGRRRRFKAAATVVLVAGVWIAPWLIKNAIVVGNPVSPFANKVFRNPYVHVAFEEVYSASMRNYDGLKSHWDIPLEVTMRGNTLGGLLGPVFLLAPIALLGRRRLVVAALVFGSIYATNVGTRFLLMALPFVALSMAILLSRIPTLLVFLVAVHAAASWPDVMKLYSNRYAWALDRIQWKAALRRESQDGFLLRKWPGYGVAKMIDASTPKSAVVFSFGQVSEAYCSRNVMVSYQSALGEVLRSILLTPIYGDMQPTRHLHFNFPSKRVRRLRVTQTAGNKPDHFAVHELRFFLHGRELPRAPQWRLRSWPNPWDVQYAFDASPVTRWSSWELLRPGMFIEVDFGAEEAVDRVVVESSIETAQARMTVDIAPDVKPVEVEAPPPLGLRREAIEVLRSKGITHLLVTGGDFGGADYFEHRKEWGLDVVGQWPDVRLYALR
jgi:hypothetical protein